MFLTRILCFNFSGAPCCTPGVTPLLVLSLSAFLTTNWHLCAALGQPTKPGFLEQHTHLVTITALANCSLHPSAAALNTRGHPQFKRTPGRTYSRQKKTAPCYLTSVLEAATWISVLIRKKKLPQEPESTADKFYHKQLCII